MITFLFASGTSELGPYFCWKRSTETKTAVMDSEYNWIQQGYIRHKQCACNIGIEWNVWLSVGLETPLSIVEGCQLARFAVANLQSFRGSEILNLKSRPT